MSATTPTIRDAEKAIRRRFVADGFRGKLEYAPDKVIETDRWWYIPFRWIGCSGFIVSKDDLYVNWLGSALSLEQCFWGHDHGVFCDLVDFTFSPETDRILAARLIARFKHMHPNARGVLPSEPVWYRDSEISEALLSQFPAFRRHFVWSSIPELRHAYEKEGLRFTCRLSKGV
jgi:hypothetical protein